MMAPLFASLLMTATSYAQTSLSEEMAFRVKNEAFNNSHVEELAQFMTDDLGPRLAASKMKLRSEKMVIDKLGEMGLTNPRAEFAYDFAKGGWDNEKVYAAMTAPYYCAFAANPKAWSGSTNGLVEAECVALEVEKEADLEKYKGKLAGKIVLMPVQQTYEMSFEPLASRYTEEEWKSWRSILVREHHGVGEVPIGRPHVSCSRRSRICFVRRMSWLLFREAVPSMSRVLVGCNIR